MSIMSDNQSVAANATILNVLAGKVHEFLSEDSIVRAYVSAAAVGMRVSVLIGAEVLVDDQEVSSSNRFPLIPDDLLAEGAGFQSDRLIVRYRNTTGAAIIVRSLVNVEPV